jgi:hypothetical protein
MGFETGDSQGAEIMPLTPNTPESASCPNTPEPSVPPSIPTIGAPEIEVEVIDGIAWYRGKKPFAELPFPPPDPEVEHEYEWAENDPQVQKEYRGLVVLVRHHKVWGAGRNCRVAREQALKTPGCPPLEDLVFMVI